MKTIGLGFARRKGFNVVSMLIRAVERTSFSHVYIRLHDDVVDRDVIFQASGTSVNFLATSIFASEEVVTDEFLVDVSDAHYAEVLRFCLDTVGKPYGLKSLLGFGIVYLGKLLGKSWPNPFRDGQRTYVCSELADVVLAEAGYAPPAADDVTPKTLYAWAQGHFARIP